MKINDTSVTNMLDDWTEALANGHIIDIIYTDFQNAFDSVPHKRIISKLKSYSIEGNVLNWINTFLNNRRQCVLINGTCSEWKKALSGCPRAASWGQYYLSYT